MRIAPVVSLIVLSLSASTGLAQDRTWKDCELADREPDRAISACSRLLARPNSRVHPGAFHNRGLALAAKGRLDEAIADIGQGIRLDPQRAYRWQERGELYSRQGKYPQALTDISEAIRIDPTRAFRFHTRGEAYRGAGDLQKAIADFSEAIRIDPISRLFRYHDRGNVLRDSGRYDLALTDYETALKLASTATGRDPRAAWVLLDRGRANARMGRAQAARADYDAAADAEPTEAELLPCLSSGFPRSKSHNTKNMDISK